MMNKKFVLTIASIHFDTRLWIFYFTKRVDTPFHKHFNKNERKLTKKERLHLPLPGGLPEPAQVRASRAAKMVLPAYLCASSLPGSFRETLSMRLFSGAKKSNQSVIVLYWISKLWAFFVAQSITM